MKRALTALIFGLGGAAILVALGVWQVQRLHWKEGVLAQISARSTSEPVPLPFEPEQSIHEFQRVALTGTVLTDEVHVYTIVNGAVAYRIVSPFVLPDDRRIMVDLGVVSETEKERAVTPIAGDFIGRIRWPDEADSFTPDPDYEDNIWFARDLNAMAALFRAEPVLVVLETPVQGRGRPLPPAFNIPNNHLEYAVTWFGLALVWLAMSGLLIRRRMQNR